MFYFIGGPARCGKTTLAKRVRQTIDTQAISGDAFKHAIKDIVLPEHVPEIFERSHTWAFHHSSDVEKIALLRVRDKKMWEFFSAYCAHIQTVSPNENVLIDGNIWPDHMHNTTLPHKVVFLVDTSQNHANHLKKLRDTKDTDNNWMREYSDEKIEAWAKFNIARSQLYVELCKKYDYAYFDIADGGIEQAAERAYQYLVV